MTIIITKKSAVHGSKLKGLRTLNREPGTLNCVLLELKEKRKKRELTINIDRMFYIYFRNLFNEEVERSSYISSVIFDIYNVPPTFCTFLRALMSTAIPELVR